MILAALRRLVVIAIVFAVISAVASQWDPGLAARSMAGYVAEVDAAEAGRLGEVDRISADISTQWESFRAHVTAAVQGLERAVEGVAPQHGAG